MDKYLNDTQDLVRQGKNQEALERFVWFHDHALEHDPAMYGVRLSFALGRWKELGDIYPPAMTAMKKTRNDKTALLENQKGNHSLFHDVVALNDTLGEDNKTVDLFKKVEVTQPEFAASVYDLADAALIAHGEYGLARKYLGDPMSRFRTAKANFDRGMEYAKTSKSRDLARRTFETIFTVRVVRIITVLDKTGDRDQAREIQSKALLVLESPVIRNAISH